MISSLAVPDNRLVVESLHKERMEKGDGLGGERAREFSSPDLLVLVLASFPFRCLPQTENLEQPSDFRQITSASPSYLLYKLQRLSLLETPLRRVYVES